MDHWRKKSLARYWTLTDEFFEWLKMDGVSSGSDDDAEIDDMKLFIKNIVMTNDDKYKEGVTAWTESMLEGLHKKVKYAKAVERILDVEGEAVRAATCMHAMAYRDLDALYASSTSKTLERLDLVRRAREAKWSEETFACMWKYMDELNSAAFDATGEARPRVPTRDEISDNIAAHKRAATGDGHPTGQSLTRACGVAINALYESRRGKSAPPLDDAALMEVRQAIADALAADSDLARRITARDDTVLGALAKVPHLQLAAPMETRDWQMLQQVTSFAQVHSAVPTRMMESIESFASKLASDLSNGSRDLTSLANLEDMGAEVLSQLNPQDVDMLAKRVDDLMPVLGNLSSSMGVTLPTSDITAND